MSNPNDKEPSKSIYLLGGRIVTGPDKLFFLLSLVLLAGSGGLYWGFSAKFVVERIHPSALAAQVFLFVLSLASMLWAGLTDPGILPRRPCPPSLDPSKNLLAEAPNPIRVRCKDVRLVLKYCDTCNIYRPPRCSHCAVCDNCVDRFDHHCPWLGNCIGKRNYRYFLFFVFSTTLACIATFSLCITEMVIRSRDNGGGASGFREALKESPLVIAIAPWMVIVVSLVGGLAGFHSFLICKNLTTNEQLKGAYKKNNPYHTGYVKYWFEVFTPPLYPRYISVPPGVQEKDAESSGSD